MENNFIKRVEAVVTRELLTGKLLTEQILAKRLGVSRGTVREVGVGFIRPAGLMCLY